LTRRQSTKNRVADSIPRLCCPTCGNSSCEWGQTGPFSSDWPSLSLHLWLWAGELGKGDLSAQNLNRTSEGGSLGCLEEFVDAGRCPRWSASWQPQVAKNLADHCGIFNGREDGQGAPALGTGGDRGGPTSLDRVAAKLSYNEVVDVMPLVSSLQGQASEDERDYTPHPVFVHRKSNEAVFGCHG